MTASPADRALSPDQFRALMSRFASGVTVVTTLDGRGRAHGMTVSAFASLSLEPPLVLVCVDRNASMFEVLDVIPYFAVNILAEDQEALSRRFSDEEMELRFEGVAYSSGIAGVPLLAGTAANVECRRVARYDAGDHGVFVAEVAGGASVNDRYPLVYFRGSYGRLER
ncbi:MAG: flavin reductase family protein [Gemmatimonadaceae bacterium]